MKKDNKELIKLLKENLKTRKEFLKHLEDKLTTENKEITLRSIRIVEEGYRTNEKWLEDITK